LPHKRFHISPSSRRYPPGGRAAERASPCPFRWGAMFDSTIIGRPVRRRNHRPRRAAATAIAVGLALMAGAWPSVLNAQRPEARPSFAEPGISPDGREIAFVSGGDIWAVPVEGGVGRLLVIVASPNP